jgi:crossover junction endodeoxyribonuclease RusA
VIAIPLPWPRKELSPNARVHFRAKAAEAKIYRENAYWTVKAGDLGPMADGQIELCIKFYPPDSRRRDLDNMFASIKSGIDGIADGLGVNDQRFAFRISREQPMPPAGKIVVTIA